MADSKAMLWIALLIMPSLLCLIGQCYLKTWGNRFSFRRASSKHPLFLFWFCLFIYQWVIFSLISSLVHGLFSSVQSFSCIQLFATPWMAACQASLSITNSHSLLKLISIESVMPFNYLILSSPSPSAFNLSQHQGLFQWVSFSHQVAKLLKFQLQHQSFQWIFRTHFH